MLSVSLLELVHNVASEGFSGRQREGGHAPVKRVGLDAPDVVGLHAVQRFHEVRQLPLEATRHAAELVALTYLATLHSTPMTLKAKSISHCSAWG